MSTNFYSDQPSSDFAIFPEIKNYTQFTFAEIQGLLNNFLESLKVCQLISNENKQTLDKFLSEIKGKDALLQTERDKLDHLLHSMQLPKTRNVTPVVRIIGTWYDSKNPLANYVILTLLKSLAINGIEVRMMPLPISKQRDFNGMILNMAHKVGSTQSDINKNLIAPLYGTEKLIDYTVSPDKANITLYSPGIIDKKRVKEIAQKLEVDFDENTREKFLLALDNINTKFNDIKNRGHATSVETEIYEIIFNTKTEALDFNDNIIKCSETAEVTQICFVNYYSGIDKKNKINLQKLQDEKVIDQTQKKAFCFNEEGRACQLVISKEYSAKQAKQAQEGATLKLQPVTHQPCGNSSATISSVASTGKTKSTEKATQKNIFFELHERFTSPKYFCGHREAQLADFAFMTATLKKFHEAAWDNGKKTISFYFSSSANPTKESFNDIRSLLEKIFLLNQVKEETGYFKTRGNLLKKSAEEIQIDFEQYYNSFLTKGNQPPESKYGKLFSLYSNQTILKAIEQAGEKGKKNVETKAYHV